MSWQLRLVLALARRIAKPHLARTGTPEDAERAFERASRFGLRRPPHLLALDRPAQVPLTWISAGPTVPRRVVLYFHGGGYVAGSPCSHSGMLGRLSRMSGVEICAPRYRLAQSAPAPAAFEDACAAWDCLIRLGYDPAHIVLGGDSAGGGLALALLARLCRSGDRPAGLFAMSPWADLTCTGPSLRSNASRDPLLPVARITELVQIVLGGTAPDDPRVSPLFARFDAPPPVFLQAAETEILLDDTLRMAGLLRAAGGDVTLDLWPDAPHVWPLLDGWVPEARAALRRIAGFVDNAFTPVC